MDVLIPDYCLYFFFYTISLIISHVVMTGKKNDAPVVLYSCCRGTLDLRIRPLR